jgi:hypothetical protein
MVELEKFPDFNGTTPEWVGHCIRFTFPIIEQIIAKSGNFVTIDPFDLGFES